MKLEEEQDLLSQRVYRELENIYDAIDEIRDSIKFMDEKVEIGNEAVLSQMKIGLSTRNLSLAEDLEFSPREKHRPPQRYRGIYFLWHNDGLLYVGQSCSVIQRVMQHQHEGKIPFSEFSYELLSNSQSLDLAEKHFILKYLPSYNSCGLSNKAREMFEGWCAKNYPSYKIDHKGAVRRFNKSQQSIKNQNKVLGYTL